MAGQARVIVIIGNPASFLPDVSGAQPGKPLQAQLGDSVLWKNQTTEFHRIAVTSADGTSRFQSDVIEPFTASAAEYVVAAGDAVASGAISYACLLHEEEKGTIAVTG